MINMNRFVLEAEKLICDYSDSDGDVRGVVVEKLKIPKVGVTVIFGVLDLVNLPFFRLLLALVSPPK